MIGRLTAVRNINNGFFVSCNFEKQTPKTTNQIEFLNNSFVYPKNYNNISFRGASSPEDYNKTSEYFASKILDSLITSCKTKKCKKNSIPANITSADLSKNKIATAIDSFFADDFIYHNHIEAKAEEIAWGEYVPESVRSGATIKINEAREHRFAKWEDFLKNPVKFTKNQGVYDKKYDDTLNQIANDNCLKFIIWNALNDDIDEDNRHIPAPFNLDALHETIIWLNSVTASNRKYQIDSKTDFIKLYSTKLKENILNKIRKGQLGDGSAEIVKENKNGEIWVKIPRINSDKHKKSLDNVYALEILSNENWCTRSGIDKAKAALQDGNFYVFLKPVKNNILDSAIGMAMHKGKIDQIQGPRNNNIIPMEQLENVKKFLEENKLETTFSISEGCPCAGIQLLMADKFNEIIPSIDMKFSKAINSKNKSLVFEALGYKVSPILPKKITREKVEEYIGGKSELMYKIEGNYIPKINLGKGGIHVVPYSFFYIDENSLLKNVSEITGDLQLCKKGNSIIKSAISEFPKNLKKVGGKVYCTEEQYDKFASDILKVIDNDLNRVSVIKE